jgi:hypothetical protein
MGPSCFKIEPPTCEFKIKTLNVPLSDTDVDIERLADPKIPNELVTTADPVLLAVVPVDRQYTRSPVLNPMVDTAIDKLAPAVTVLAAVEEVIC